MIKIYFNFTKFYLIKEIKCENESDQRLDLCRASTRDF